MWQISDFPSNAKCGVCQEVLWGSARQGSKCQGSSFVSYLKLENKRIKTKNKKQKTKTKAKAKAKAKATNKQKQKIICHVISFTL